MGGRVCLSEVISDMRVSRGMLVEQTTRGRGISQHLELKNPFCPISYDPWLYQDLKTVFWLCRTQPSRAPPGGSP